MNKLFKPETKVDRLKVEASFAADFIHHIYTEKKLLRGVWARTAIDIEEKLRKAIKEVSND